MTATVSSRLRTALTGVSAVVVAPYRAGRVSAELTEQIVERIDAAGIHAITALGNTAEVFQLSAEERRTHVAAVGAAATRAVRLAGVSGAGVTVLDDTETARDLGHDAVMLHEPADPFGDAAGLVAYYRAIADRSALPLVLYVRSARLGVAGLTELAAHPAVAGVKFALPDLSVLDELRRHTAAAAGTDADCIWINGAAEGRAPAMAERGITGFTSGIANARPDLALAVHRALEAGDAAAVAALHALLAPVEEIRAEQNARFNVAVLKELLRGAGIEAGPVRAPHSALSASAETALAEAIAHWPADIVATA